MTYFEEGRQAATLDRWMEFEKDHQYRRAAVIGLGIYMNTIAGSLEQMRRARQASAAGTRSLGVSLFSYAATNTAPATPGEFFKAAGEFFAEDAAPPDLPWKSRPETGNVCGTVEIEGGPEWLNDDAGVYLERASDGEAVRLATDATGFFGAADVAPGWYRIGLGPGCRISEFKEVTAGAVVRFTLKLRSSNDQSSVDADCGGCAVGGRCVVPVE
jgi:hypothetical protein